MKRARLIFLALFMPVFLSGCAAINARNIDGAGRPYIGVRGDAYALANPGEVDNPLLLPLCILDLPFSFVVDTICLPYDLVEADRARTFDPHPRPVSGRP